MCERVYPCEPENSLGVVDVVVVVVVCVKVESEFKKIVSELVPIAVAELVPIAVTCADCISGASR